MYELSVTSHFAAAHQVLEYEGKCENLHGHNWKVELVVGAEELDRLDMIVDFRELKKALAATLDQLDHRFLNELEMFAEHNPTSERIAEWIYNDVASRLAGAPCQLKRATVWESDTSSATYMRTD